MNHKGRLLLVPAPFVFGGASTTPLQDVLPQGTRVAAAQLGLWVCENAKSEGLGIALLERIDSDDPTSLIGLPLMRTCALLRELGIRVPA